MSRATNILIVIIASLVVIAACILNIAGLLGSLRYGTTAEWADLFKWNDTSFINTYTTIDSDYIGKKQGEIVSTISRSVDTLTYVPENGEATCLSKGTDIFEIKGFNTAEYLAVDDGGDYFLYCTHPDSLPEDLIERCAAKTYKEPVDFVYVSIPTASKTASDSIVRIRIIDSPGDFESYLDRYEKDFRRSNGTYTYSSAVNDRGYGDASFFAEKKIIAIYVPEEDGSSVYSVSSLMADDSRMTLILKKTVLPLGIKYDTSASRHMFLEIDADEYSDQKLSYQIEHSIIPNEEILAGVSVNYAMKANVKKAFSLYDILGTKYEPLVKGVYTREYFDDNMLIILECYDTEGVGRYSLDYTEAAGGLFRIYIDKSYDEDSVPDRRMQYIIVELPEREYNDELVLPMVYIDETELAPDPDETLPYPDGTDIFDDTEITDVGDVTDITEHPDETSPETDVTDDTNIPDETVTDGEADSTDVPDGSEDTDGSDTPEPDVDVVPEDYYPRTLTVVENVETVKQLCEMYSIQTELYDDAFFKNYILIFVGDIFSSESVDFRYRSCIKTEEGIEITVDQTIPEKCVNRPASKFIAIPYLKSQYNGEKLVAKINTIYESQLSPHTVVE